MENDSEDEDNTGNVNFGRPGKDANLGVFSK